MSPTGMTPDGKKRQVDLRHAVKMMAGGLWPTPTAMTDTGGAALCKWGGSRSRQKLKLLVTPAELNGPLNPGFVCWLMGYPTEWTSLPLSATRSSRKSRN
jgi:hypothetical protein